MDFVFEVPGNQVFFIFSLPNVLFGGGEVGGDINIYIDGELDQTVTTADYSNENLIIE